MLRRVIDANGRSRAFINGTSATLAQLRELGEMLVDIHGQHAHQLLMRPDAQRELFDTHAGLSADAAVVARGWRAWRDALHHIEVAQTHERELQLEREKLAWQLAELDKLAPQPGEWDEVNAEHQRLSHSANLIDGVQGALLAISESDEAMLTQLGAIISKVRQLAAIDPTLNDALASLDPAEIQLREASYSLSHYAQRLELDPERLAQVEARLDALHSAARKFRLPPETLHDEHAARREQLAALDAAADLVGAAGNRRARPAGLPGRCAHAVEGARPGRRGAGRRGHGRHAGTVDGGRQLRGRAAAARPRAARTGSSRSSSASPATPACRCARWRRSPRAASWRASAWRWR